MTLFTTQVQIVAAVAAGVGIAMVRMGLRAGMLSVRQTRRCPSCGRQIDGRVCRNCTGA
jgi:hypothetical protein